uniref:hypothetical protein n=1 Tax=Candidatus Entotheonella palauensis TaxID=93172 RepID=UPI0015C41B10
ADAIRGQSWLRAPVRTALTPLVWGVQGWGYSQRRPWIISVLGLVTAGGLGSVWWRRRPHAPASIRSVNPDASDVSRDLP